MHEFQKLKLEKRLTFRLQKVKPLKFSVFDIFLVSDNFLKIFLAP